MIVLDLRNAHQALTHGLELLEKRGLYSDSRNGRVLVLPEPVTTIYRQPRERVVFWEERDANPFFHIYESLWMLAGRNDLKPLLRYVRDFGKFSDDGDTLNGAYGWRWRHQFDKDQIQIIVERLRRDPTDRRAVLTMWDAREDLGSSSKDVPCNLVVTFQVARSRSFQVARRGLDMTVFCRSNDIVWGAYGANAVHFSFLHEYVANATGHEMGVYRQISVNYHGYLETLEQVRSLPRHTFDEYDPYAKREVFPVRLEGHPDYVDATIKSILHEVDTENFDLAANVSDWHLIFQQLLLAHHLWRTLPAPERYTKALEVVAGLPRTADWVRASREWLLRRMRRWDATMSSRAYSAVAERTAEQRLMMKEKDKTTEKCAACGKDVPRIDGKLMPHIDHRGETCAGR